MSVAIGDFNGDGKLDLVVTNNGSTTISVLLNTIDPLSLMTPSFANKVDFVTGGGPSSLAIGDFNGDGKPDLAVASSTSTFVSVLRNTFDPLSPMTPKFATRISFVTGTNPYSMAIGDFNGDDKPDLAVANYSSTTVSILLNTFNPLVSMNLRFATKVDFVTGNNPYSVAIGDLDRKSVV